MKEWFLEEKQLVLDIINGYHSSMKYWRSYYEHEKMDPNSEEGTPEEIDKHIKFWKAKEQWSKDFIKRFKGKDFFFTKKDAEMWIDLCDREGFEGEDLIDYFMNVLHHSDFTQVDKAENLLDNVPGMMQRYLDALKAIDTQTSAGEQQDIADI